MGWDVQYLTTWLIQFSKFTSTVACREERNHCTTTSTTLPLYKFVLIYSQWQMTTQWYNTAFEGYQTYCRDCRLTAYKKPKLGRFCFYRLSKPQLKSTIYNIIVSFGSERVNFGIKLCTYVATMYTLQQSTFNIKKNIASAGYYYTTEYDGGQPRCQCRHVT